MKEYMRFKPDELDIAIDKQPLEGLLYDLDLLPEQIQNEIDFNRMQIVERLYARVKKAEEAPHA